MVKYGAFLTCDRCGKGKFTESREHVICPGSGWSWYDSKSDTCLCPDCTDLYNKMMNNFFAPEVKWPINLED